MTTKIADGTPVLMIGQTDEKAAPVRENTDHLSECLVGNFVCFATTWARVAPAAEVTVPVLTGKESGVEVRKHSEAPMSYQRRMWIVRVGGVYVGHYNTKRDGLAAAAVAVAVLGWHAAQVVAA